MVWFHSNVLCIRFLIICKKRQGRKNERKDGEGEEGTIVVVIVVAGRGFVFFHSCGSSASGLPVIFIVFFSPTKTSCPPDLPVAQLAQSLPAFAQPAQSLQWLKRPYCTLKIKITFRIADLQRVSSPQRYLFG